MLVKMCRQMELLPTVMGCRLSLDRTLGVAGLVGVVV